MIDFPALRHRYLAITPPKTGCSAASESRSFNAREAIRICEDLAQPVDLMISQVVMPDLRGMELSECLIVIRPGLRVQKSFTLADLASSIDFGKRGVLGSGSRKRGASYSPAYCKDAYQLPRPFGVKSSIL